VAIKFCVKAGKSAVEMIELINKAYGSTAMSRAIVYRWYARFRDGREDVKDDARSGRPSTARTDENAESVGRLQTSELPTCTLDGHLHRVTYTRCCIHTIDSPDDVHGVARNM
jgi:transposase